MDAILFQDWVTLGGGDASASVTQDASRYLDTSKAIDIVVWVQSSSVVSGGGKPTLSLETSALWEDGGFTPITPEFGIAEGPPDIKIVRGSGPLPPGTLLRWRVRNSGASMVWSVSLRIFVSFSHCRSIPSPLKLKEPRAGARTELAANPAGFARSSGTPGDRRREED